MILVKGDIFEIAKAMTAYPFPDVTLGHGCNMKGLMGAGIAKTVREKYPHAYSAYKIACNEQRYKLGEVQFVGQQGNNITIANMFTQEHPGPDAKMWAIERAILKAMERDTEKGWKIPLVIPMIGAGIGGLDPKDVMSVYEQFNDNLVVVEYK